MRDRVLYRLPVGFAGRLAHWLFVRPALEEIFAYRAKTVAEMLGSAEQVKTIALAAFQ